MAGEVDDIVQNIVLTGNPEVEEAFNRIQEAGTRAFEAIARSIEHIGSFKGMAEAIGGVTAALTVAGVGAFAFTKGMSDVVNEMSELASQAGVTIEDMSSLNAAFARQGVDSGELGQAYRRLSVNVQQSWDEIKKAARDGADQQRSDFLSVANAQLALTQAERNAANSAQDNRLQRQKNSESLASAELSEREARLKMRQLQGEDVSGEQQLLALQRASLEVEEAATRVKEAKLKQQRDLIEAAEREKKAQIEAEQAQLNLNSARKKAADDAANDIGNIVGALDKFVAGNREALNSVNASAENLARGIIASSGRGRDALDKLRGGIVDLSQPAPEVKDVFDRMSEVFSRTENNALKTAIAVRLLGRNVGQDFIEVLSQGPAKLQEFQNRIQELGLAITDADENRLKKFRVSLFTLTTDVQLVAAKIAAAFGPAFSKILDAIDDAIVSNKDKMTKWAEDVSNKVVPVIESFIRVLSGVPDAAKDQWLTDYTSKLATIVTVIEQVVSKVGGIVVRIAEFFQASAERINDVFGTNLNAVDLIFAAFFAKNILKLIAFTGAFEAAAIAIKAALAEAVATNGLLAVIGAFGQLATKLTIVIGLLYELYKIFQIFTDSQEKQDAREAARQRNRQIEKDQLNPDTRVSEAEKTRKIRESNEQLEKDLSEIDKRDRDRKLDQDNLEKQIAANAAKREKDLATTASDSARSSEKAVSDSYKRIADAAKSSAEERVKTNQRTAQNEKQTSDSVQREKDRIERSIASGNIPGVAASPVDLSSQRQRLLSDEQRFGQHTVEGDRAQREAARAAGRNFGNEVFPPQIVEPRAQTTPVTIQTGDEIQRAEVIKAPIQEAVKQGVLEAAAARNQTLNDQSRPDTAIPSGQAAASPPTVIDEFLRALRQQGENPPSIDGSGGGLQKLIDTLSGFINRLVPNEAATPQQGPVDSLGVRGEAEAASQVASALDTVNGAMASFADAANSAAASIQEAASRIGSASQQVANNTVAAAGGGLITGPGGPRDDAVNARLSNGEYVHQADAVSFWGVDFMHAINNMRMPAFKLGGLFGSLLSPSLPRFAAGGGPVMVSSGGTGSMQHLGSIDLTTDGGTFRVYADAPAVSQLKRAAVRQRLTSTTKRAPGWKGG